MTSVRVAGLTSILILLTVRVVVGDGEPLIHMGMTERQVLYAAGVPDGAEIKLNWDEFQRLRNAGAAISGVEYELTYITLRKEMPVLRGPLGKATECRIGLSKGKVVQVIWNYRTAWGEAAKQALLNDHAYDVRPIGVTLAGSRHAKEGDYMVIVQMANNAETEVILTPH